MYTGIFFINLLVSCRFFTLETVREYSGNAAAFIQLNFDSDANIMDTHSYNCSSLFHLIILLCHITDVCYC